MRGLYCEEIKVKNVKNVEKKKKISPKQII